MRGVGGTPWKLWRERGGLHRIRGAHTPHPSGFACHLLPQGEKGDRAFLNGLLTILSAFSAQFPGVVMSGAEVLDIGRDAIWLTIQLCAPVLVVGLVVGVVIGLFQALTQIQEQTLIYAPKIIAIFVSLLLFLPLMGALLGGFMREIAARIAGM
jgi:flagellar biosynthetic protein FliQ